MNEFDNEKYRTRKALKTLYQRIQNEIRGIIIYSIKKKGLNYAYQAVPREIMLRLFDEYNLNLKYLEKFVDMNYLMSIKPMESNHKTFGQLYTLTIECDKIITLLQEDISDMNISQKFINQLNSLKEDIENENIPDYGIQKNLEKSIELFEKGDVVSSALFASRVISYTINQFRIDEDLIKENLIKKNKDSKIKLIIKDCIAKSLIDKDNKSYVNNLLQYIHLARNRLTHDVLFFPEASECLGILSNSIELVKLKIKFDEKLQSE